MKIHQITEQNLAEGPHDKHIFKAVFLAGGPGSGKSYVSKGLLSGYGLKAINSDDIYEYMAHKQELDLGDPDAVASPEGQEIRDRAKKLTSHRENAYLSGRLGIIIDGTGKNTDKVKKASDDLRKLGYSTMMLFVNTDLEVAQARNLQRPRKLPTEMVSKMWNAVQSNIMKFQQVFGASNFHIVDNSGGLEDPARKQNFDNVEKLIRAFITSPPTNRFAIKWLQDNKTGTPNS